jgi:hypothetical protein
METSIQENIPEIKAKENGLKHGQFKATFKTSDKRTVEYVVNHPTQEELADGWRLVVPHRSKNSTIHHFSVYLSQLHPYLWKAFRTSWTDNTKHYNPIDDGIYQYSVKMSKHDEYIQKLFNLVMNKYSDRSQVAKLHDYLEKQRVKGWLMIRAKNIISA